MLIVDAQVHIWESGLPTNPAHRQITAYPMNDLLKEMDEGGVDAAVIHPPGWDSNSNQIATEAAKAQPNRLSVLGNFPLDDPAASTPPSSISLSKVQTQVEGAAPGR